MNNQYIVTARSMAQHIFEVEETIDQAIAAAAQLAAFMPVARKTVNASAAVGQEAIENISRTIATLSAARKEIIATHEALAATQGKIGLRERNFGGFVDKPTLTQDKIAIVRSIRNVA